MAFFFLSIYAIALLIRPHEWPFLGLGETSIIKICLAICILIFIPHRNKNFDAPQVTLVLLLTLAIALSVFFTGWIGGVLIFTETFLRTAVIPLLLLNAFLESPKKQYVMFSIILITCMIMVSNGHVQVNSEDGLGWVGNLVYTNGDLIRINYVGFFNDPNDLGMFLVMSIPIAILLAKKANPILKLPIYLCVPVLLYGIFLTNSRGTLLATLCIMGFWFWDKYGTKKTIYLGVICLPVLFFILSNFREIDANEESSQGRLDAWYAGYEMFMSSPIFGVGRGNFIEYHHLTAHNSFVLAFAELGFFGCIIWTALMLSTVIILLRIAKKRFVPEGIPEDDKRMLLANEEADIAMAFLYCFLAFAVSSFFLSRTYIPFLYFFLGMAAACLGRVKKIFPESKISIYTNRELGILSGSTATAGIFSIYLLIKVAL